VSNESEYAPCHNSNVVFCPTRDRPEQLTKTINALVRDIESGDCSNSQVLLIDDSTMPSAREKNRNTATQGGPVTYHGPEEQRRFLDRMLQSRVIEAGADTLGRFVRWLGGKEWDLGGVRNYLAILGAALTASDRSFIAMIDDDVELDNRSQENGRGSIECLWKKLEHDENCIVGGCLSGMPDISMVERAELEFRKAEGLKALELCEPPFPVSGGFLAYRQKWLMRVPFPRSYNEDWIWLTGCAWRGAIVARTNAQGTHAWSPMKHCKTSELEREMMGEVLSSGLQLAHASNAHIDDLCATARDPAFWQKMIRNEYKALDGRRYRLQEQMQQKGIAGKEWKIHDVMDCALKSLLHLNPERIKHQAQRYLRDIRLWEQLFQDVAPRTMSNILGHSD